MKYGSELILCGKLKKAKKPKLKKERKHTTKKRTKRTESTVKALYKLYTFLYTIQRKEGDEKRNEKRNNGNETKDNASPVCREVYTVIADRTVRNVLANERGTNRADILIPNTEGTDNS